MKDKNTIIGWVLIALVFIGFMIYSNHQAVEQDSNLGLTEIQIPFIPH
jgi:hypothetical protein